MELQDFDIYDIMTDLDTVRNYVRNLHWGDALAMLDHLIYVCPEFLDPDIVDKVVEKMEFSAEFIREGYRVSQIDERSGREGHLQESIQGSAVDSLTDLILYLDLLADPRLNSSSGVRSTSAGYSRRPVMSALSKSLKADIDRVVDLVERGDYSEAANLMGDCRDKYATGKNASSEVISLMEELTGYMYQASDYERSEQYDYAQEEAWSVLDIIKDDLLPMLKKKESAKPGKSKASAVQIDTSDLRNKFPDLLYELEAIGSGSNASNYKSIHSDTRRTFQAITNIFLSILTALSTQAKSLLSASGPDSPEYTSFLERLRVLADCILDNYSSLIGDGDNNYGVLADCLQELDDTGTLGSESSLKRFLTALNRCCYWAAYFGHTDMPYKKWKTAYDDALRFYYQFGNILGDITK